MDAARHTESQFQAWDMMRGDLAEELGGSPEMLDLIGVNFYWNQPVGAWRGEGYAGQSLPQAAARDAAGVVGEVRAAYPDHGDGAAEAGAGVGWLGVYLG